MIPPTIKKSLNSVQIPSPYYSKDGRQLTKQKKYYPSKQKTSSAYEDQSNNQLFPNVHNDDDPQQMKLQTEFKKKNSIEQPYSKVFDKELFQKVALLNNIREQLDENQPINKIQGESKVEKGANKTLRIRNLDKIHYKNQERKSKELEEDLISNNNEQVDNQNLQKLGLLIPQKTKELQDLKNSISQLSKKKVEIQSFLEIAFQRIQQSPDLQKIYLFRSSSFETNKTKQVELQKDERNLAIDQNITVKINQLNQKGDEVKKLNTKNKTLLEDNHILNNQVEEKEKQINILDKYIKDNTDIIQQLQNDIQAKNQLNSNLNKLIKKQVSDLTEQQLKIDQQKIQIENIEKLNYELQNQNKEIEKIQELKNTNSQNYIQEIEQLKVNLDEKKIENEQLNNKLINLNSEIDNQNKIVQELKQEIENYNNNNILEKDQNIINLKNEQEYIKTNLEIKDQKIQELTLKIDESNIEINKLKNEIIENKDQIINLQLDSDLLKYSDDIISLQVKSVNSNKSEILKVRLKDSMNDLYIMAISKQIITQFITSTELLQKFSAFVPSKNKRYSTSEWNKKFYDIFQPTDYRQTITIEFGGLR